jgi:hypothetical protein
MLLSLLLLPLPHIVLLQVVWLDDVMAGDTLEVALVYPVLVDADAAPANIGTIESLQTLLESKALGGDILVELDHWYVL